MTDQPLLTSDALTTTSTIPEAWSLRGFANRCDLLSAALTKLPLSADHREQSRLLPLLLDHARRLEFPVTLPDPTGESNELFAAARGLTLVFGSGDATPRALAGQLFVALACGNPVILSGGVETEWSNRMVMLLHRVGVPRAALGFSESETPEALLQLPSLALVAPVCRLEELLPLQRQLTRRAGHLVQLAAETDPLGCTTLLQPDHLYRFVTEKTRTINTTAIGGNAALIELGSRSN